MIFIGTSTLLVPLCVALVVWVHRMDSDEARRMQDARRRLARNDRRLVVDLKPNLRVVRGDKS